MNANATDQPIVIAQLSEKGQLTIPAEYRRLHALTRGSSLAIVPVGDALVLVPHDDALSAISTRLEAALRGVTVEDLLYAAGEARAEIFAEEFGADEDSGR